MKKPLGGKAVTAPAVWLSVSLR